MMPHRAQAAGKQDSNAYKGIAEDGLTISGYFDDPQAVPLWEGCQ
jgi:hypothetical protein